MRWFALTLAVLLAAGLSGCGRKVNEQSGTPAPIATLTVAEDMCAEHGVLEAVCTRCHPKLIPVFQAKGDWCAEHGFPMSVCPIHHPERGGRPEAQIAIDEAPASGTMIRFKSLEIARDAGIETVRAVEGTAGVGVLATATLVTDASHMAVVSPQARGVVRSIRADLGRRVAKGDALAVLESSTVGEDRQRLSAALARESVAAANHAREKKLYDRGVSALRQVEEARREWESAKAEVGAAEAAVNIIGTADGNTGTAGGNASTYVVRAPIAGIVTRRTASVGTLAEIGDALFEIVDVSELWAEIDVPEAQAGRVREGQRVLLRIDGLPDREFPGTLRFVSPVIDPHTRTTKARASLPNRDGLLRANMYARARIVDDANALRVLVPKTAVQEAKGVQLVFVQLAPDAYETRRVKTAPAENDMVAIAADVRPGESVVTTGSFLLKTETLKESIGAGCCEVAPPKKKQE